MSAAAFDRTKTLDELDPPAWGPPTYSSYLVTTCHRLSAKPLNEFDETTAQGHARRFVERGIDSFRFMAEPLGQFHNGLHDKATDG